MTHTPKNPVNKNLHGIAYALLHASIVPLIYVLVKELTKSMSTSQAVFFYRLTLLLFITPFLLKKRISFLKTKKIHLHLLRSMFSTIASISILYCVRFIEIIDITAITYLENLLIAVLGILFFQEKFSWVKITAIPLCCFGMLIILYPNLLNNLDGSKMHHYKAFVSNKNYGLLFIAVFFQLCNWLILKKLGKTESNSQQLFYLTFLSTISGFFIAFSDWSNFNYLYINTWLPKHFDFSVVNTLNLAQLYLIIGISICYLLHSSAIFKAFQYTDMSIISSFDYSRLLFAGIYGFVFFRQYPPRNAFIGYFLIIFSGLLIIYEERKLLKMKK